MDARREPTLPDFVELERFADGQRVLVWMLCKHPADAFGVPLPEAPRAGKVVKLRKADHGAWIELDERHASDAFFPFDDERRRRHVLTYPEFCEACP